ncbi:protein of unknown function DUF752 [Bacteroides coprosuis DSM 18011]|uniref:MnmC-like methyltransferase domain-containing protein n=1 Tax=Bacteroides coprosuis DSM 18011 TaxID=679937 RepID=F3ZQG7_9BACE|nr:MULTISPECIES: tRNA (5-methylaminomethyl-2-thiouridine)(34)-methyltransferase MnmD [Bacteroides]EGJ70545.1 protein of unknown function DUF752 [Bacteroides coprosuis DSM 18011]HJD92674.1 tRNA (5-methylaminomethyl-2-thiouridine)(34)-methyltransferase MnmD [Bacteroides coprosuis]
MNHITIEKTEDGSDTLYVPSMNEHYHSTKGALTETQHIFINMGLLASSKKDINVFEVGFGTGLNAIQTLEAALNNELTIHYHSVELFPLSWSDVSHLSYAQLPFFKELHEAKWNNEVEINSSFYLTKYQLDFTELPQTEINIHFDVIYFDAFAPEKQPQMWSQQLFDYLYVLLNKGGVLTTYCAKGVVRRMLQTAGFQVERLPGPPGGKREILRATK